MDSLGDDQTNRNKRIVKAFVDKPWLFLILGLLIGGFCSCLIMVTAFTYKNNPQLLGSLPLISSFFPRTTPGADCGGPALTLGATTIPFETVEIGTNGSISLPSGLSGVAYWVKGIEGSYLFVLYPTVDNYTLVDTLQRGEEGTITWENCNSAKYILSAPEPGKQGMEIIQDRPASRLIVFLPDSSLTPGLIVQGEQLEEVFKPFETAEPGAFVIDAEVSLLETTTSADGTTIQVIVSILNYGTTQFFLTDGDILLIPEDAAPLALIQSDPSLPQELKPKESKTFTLDFPHPSSPTATLKIYNIEFFLENY